MVTKAIIFDMDGVIFDSERIYLKNWQKIFKKYGYKMTKEVYTQAMGIGRKKIIPLFKKEFGEDLPIHKMYEEKDKELNKYIDDNIIPLKPGVREVLDFLKANEYKVALATSSRRDRVAKYLSKSKLSDKFDVIICGDEVENSKPHPEIFLKSAKKLNVKPEECIIVEDSKAGIKAGNNAEMKVIHIPDLKASDEYMVNNAYEIFQDLFGLIEFLDCNIDLERYA